MSSFNAVLVTRIVCVCVCGGGGVTVCQRFSTNGAMVSGIGNKLQICEGPWLLFVACHEETQDKVYRFLPVLLRLPAREVGRRSDEEAAEKCC